MLPFAVPKLNTARLTIEAETSAGIRGSVVIQNTETIQMPRETKSVIEETAYATFGIPDSTRLVIRARNRLSSHVGAQNEDLNILRYQYTLPGVKRFPENHPIFISVKCGYCGNGLMKKRKSVRRTYSRYLGN